MIAPPARTVRTAVVTAVLTCSIGFLAASWPGPGTAAAAQAAATDIYQYAGECVIVRDQLSNRYVVRDAVGYGLQALASAATPFRMQATEAGHAALQLTSVSTGQHLSVGSLGRLLQSGGPNPRWRFDAAEGCATFPEISVDVDVIPSPGAGTAPRTP